QVQAGSDSGIDLALEDLQFAQPATLVAGPAYRVKFRNQGTQAAGKFRVGLLGAVGGKASPDAPRAAVEVPALAAGQTGEVTIRLPRSASAAYSELVVAVDLDGAVSELDKDNNVALVERAQLETASR